MTKDDFDEKKSNNPISRTLEKGVDTVEWAGMGVVNGGEWAYKEVAWGIGWVVAAPFDSNNYPKALQWDRKKDDKDF